MKSKENPLVVVIRLGFFLHIVYNRGNEKTYGTWLHLIMALFLKLPRKISFFSRIIHMFSVQ